VNRVSIVSMLLSVCVNIIKPSYVLNSLSCLFVCFRKINHMAINHLHSSSDATSLYVIVTSGTIRSMYELMQRKLIIRCMS
jgi:hypothetical protein